MSVPRAAWMAALGAGGHVPPADVDSAMCRKWDLPLSKVAAVYTTLQFALLLLGTTLYLNAAGRLSRAGLAVGASLIVVSLVALGGLLEGRRWAPYLEAGRVATAPGFLAFWLRP